MKRDPVGADALGGPPRPFVSLRTSAALPPLKREVSPAFAPVTEGFSVAIRIPRPVGEGLAPPVCPLKAENQYGTSNL